MKKSTFLLVFYALFLTIATPMKLSAQWVATGTLSPAYANCIGAKGDIVYVGTLSNGVYLSSDKGATWTLANTGLTKLSVYSISIIGDSVYAGTTGGGLFKTNLGGSSWTASNSGIPTTPIINTVYEYFSKLHTATSNGGVYVSNDRGSSWTVNNSGLPSYIINGFLGLDTTLYIATGGSKGLYKSGPNSGWVKSNTGLPANGINAITYIRDNTATTLFAATGGGGVYTSTDGGANWTVANTGLDNLFVSTLIVVNGVLYAGNDYSVYVSSNKGASWSALNDGLSSASYATSLKATNNSIYVIYKGQVFRRAINTSEVKEQKTGEKPATFNLSQNYPNPFNPSTTISFSLPEKMNAKLTVYNAIGQVVDVLADHEFSAGTHSLNWTASHLSSGIYFYELRTEKFSSVKKLILTK